MSEMTNDESINEGRAPVHTTVVIVTVNNRQVTLPDHKTTGREIKEAAIAQGVAIQITFALFRLTGHQQHPVRDDDRVTVHNDEKFRCVDSDDNS